MIIDHETTVRSVADLAGLIAHGAGQAIDIAINEGKRIPITRLSEEMAEKTGTDKVLCYHIISKYIETRGDLIIKFGPKGGITLKEKSVEKTAE